MGGELLEQRNAHPSGGFRVDDGELEMPIYTHDGGFAFLYV